MEGAKLLHRTLCICFVVLASIGNTPLTGVEAQLGTTGRPTTIPPLRTSTLGTTVRRPVTTLPPTRGTSNGFTGRPTTRFPNTGPSKPATVGPGGTMRPTGTGRTTKTTKTTPTTTTTASVREATNSTTSNPTSTSGSTLATSTTNTTTTTAKKSTTVTEVTASKSTTQTTDASTTSEPTTTSSRRPNVATSTTQSTVTTTPHVSKTGYVVQYVLPADGSKLSNVDSLNTCEANNLMALSTVLNIPQDRITNTKCESYSDSQNSITSRVLVTLEISPGQSPNDNDLEALKTGKKAFKPKGPQNVARTIVPGTFRYREGDFQSNSSGVTPATGASTNNQFLGLADTYWVLIGMGAVIILLVIISVVVICIGRSDTGVRPQRTDSEIEERYRAEEIPEKKKKRFPWQKKKKDDDMESNPDASDSERGESAYGSNPELDHGIPYDRYMDDEDEKSRTSSNMQDDDKII